MPLSLTSYSGCEVRVTAQRTEVIIKATRTQSVLGEKGRRIRELTTALEKRFKFEPGAIEVGILYCCSLFIDVATILIPPTIAIAVR